MSTEAQRCGTCGYFTRIPRTPAGYCDCPAPDCAARRRAMYANEGTTCPTYQERDNA